MFVTKRFSQFTSKIQTNRLSDGVVFAFLIIVFAACESPVEPDTVQSSAKEFQTTAMASTEAGMMSISMMNAEEETIVVESDGTMRAYVEGEEGIEITRVSDNRVAMVITGSATFEHSTVQQLRLNVRQTGDGGITGKGSVTFHSFFTKNNHTTDFVATCIKPISGWGRTNYGITMELAEPYEPYGNGVFFGYAIVSITEDGHLDPSYLLRSNAVCGGSISSYNNPNRMSGNMNVLAKE